MTTLRCAIYTRKSNEEGLEQAFNTLEAQREAGLDYIRSQKHQGWKAIRTRYDDGGYSGGTMKRPGLEALLDDIERGAIDVVVVYKVDRLSRSLTDFARIMQQFDERGVSFVSVTQQFNTTTSMGRLTLNMLLSFAQFEREVSGERVRDKIAATKKKGYWVCGQPPLGYRLQREGEERGIYIIEEQAELVREIFRRFAERPSYVEVAEGLHAQGHTTKRWLSGAGNWRGGSRITVPYVRGILTNPVYIGKIAATSDRSEELYEGRHKPIIEQALWDRVHSLIDAQETDSRRRWTHGHLLKGKLRTYEDYAMSPSSVQRPLTKRGDTGQRRLFRYYTSQKGLRQGYASCAIKTVNAQHLDDLVRALVMEHVGNDRLDGQPQEERDVLIREAIDRVILAPDKISIRLLAERVDALRKREFETVSDGAVPRPISPFTPKVRRKGEIVTFSLAIQIKRHDGRRMVLSPQGHDLVMPAEPEPKRHIVEAIGLAYRWHRALRDRGISARALADECGVAHARILHLLPLARLGPAVLRAALTGRLAPSVTLKDLLQAAESLDWEWQARALRIDAIPGR